MAEVLGTHMLAQVGFIVKDVEETKKKWAEFLGVDVPETQPIGDFATTQTNFQGEPATLPRQMSSAQIINIIAQHSP